MEAIIALTESQLTEIISRAASEVAAKLRTDIEKRRIPEIMTKADVAEYLRCHISKIDRKMREGMPWFSFGSHPRFRRSQIDRWLEECERLQEMEREENNGSGQELVEGDLVC